MTPEKIKVLPLYLWRRRQVTIAMDRSKWENIFIRFQACARGYLVRTEVHRAREDFEDIVREIDGGLSHLKWRDTVISIPHFTDTAGPLVTSSRPGPDASDCLLHPSGTDNHLLQERIEAERDNSDIQEKACPISKDCTLCSSVRGDGERQRERGLGGQMDGDGGVMESTGDSTSVWSNLELDMNYGNSYKGPQQSCLAQDVPRTPEALRLHRNTLTMELIWLQQAIDSRKKYLSLKDRLSVS
ncbi:hypothetical protein LDENG_00008640 [Lucifuga dentata]|nr:hypothetical protein LDENG_00008640 [Lucifuga dentata]